MMLHLPGNANFFRISCMRAYKLNKEIVRNFTTESELMNIYFFLLEILREYGIKQFIAVVCAYICLNLVFFKRKALVFFISIKALQFFSILM